MSKGPIFVSMVDAGYLEGEEESISMVLKIFIVFLIIIYLFIFKSNILIVF